MKGMPVKIGDLTLQRPIFQGGMGIGISLSRLAGAVAAEGGAGTISAAQIGFLEKDFDENPLKANLRAMGRELQKARELAKGGVVGFNIMVAMNHYEEYVREAAELGADFIVSGAGLPVELPALVRTFPIKIAPIVSMEKSARVILQYWSKKFDRIPDFLVIEGPKAGGHLGFTKEQLEHFDPDTYGDEVGRIIRRVREYEERFGQKIAVVLGGGISDREQADGAFRLGTDAIQVASRFVATRECDADEAYKQTYLDAGKEDIVLVKSPVGMPGRAIRNGFLERVQKGERIPPKKCRGCLRRCKPAEIPYCITEALIHAAKGEVEDALLFCGADTWKITELGTVKSVMDELLGPTV
ncbi:nitronate monooxygenase [bacterium 1XD21-13]|nr:nitronate monooxygenase [bacterium 1XD21-13]